ISLARDPHLILVHAGHLAIFLAPFWFLLALGWQKIVPRLRARSWADWATLATGVCLLLTFTFLDVADQAGYKFYAMAVFCLAPLAAWGLVRIRDSNRAAFVMLLAVFLLPATLEFASKWPSRWTSVTEPYYWQGAVIRHGIPAEDSLYQWIRNN